MILTSRLMMLMQHQGCDVLSCVSGRTKRTNPTWIRGLSQTVSLSGTFFSFSPTKMTILLLHWLAWERDTSKLPCLQASFRPFYSFIRAAGISNAHNEHEFLFNFGLFVRWVQATRRMASRRAERAFSIMGTLKSKSRSNMDYDILEGYMRIKIKI